MLDYRLCAACIVQKVNERFINFQNMSFCVFILTIKCLNFTFYIKIVLIVRMCNMCKATSVLNHRFNS